MTSEPADQIHASGQASTDAAPATVLAKLKAGADAYRGDAERPIGGYALLLSAYSTVGIGALTTVAMRKRNARLTAGDIALIAVATHKIARTLTKSAVTSPLRAPFTRYTGVSGPAELSEEVRHHGGVRHALGELVTCPFCVSQWIATTLTVGILVAPQPTRVVASVFAAVAGSDFLQFAYAAAEQAVE